jgi:hypothetical protein
MAKKNPFMKKATAKPMVSKKAQKGEKETKRDVKRGAKAGC